MPVTATSTRGSVLFSTLASNPSRSLDDFLEQGLSGTAAAEEAYKQKYRDKLVEAARQKGYTTVDDMLADQKKKKQEQKRLLAASTESTSVSSPNSSSTTSRSSSTSTTAKSTLNNLPPDVKRLDDIVKLDLLKNESAEKIGEIWNTFHSTRSSCLSACLDSTFYDSLLSKSKLFPMVNRVCNQEAFFSNANLSTSLFFHYRETMDLKSFSSNFRDTKCSLHNYLSTR